MKLLTRDGSQKDALDTLELEAFQAELAKTVEPAVGVDLEPDADVEALAKTLLQAPIIRLNFPKFRDGRAFSQARLLRARLGFKGLLVAHGPVTPDQAQFLWRTGFDAVTLPAESKIAAWQAASKRFEMFHQPAVGDHEA